MARPTIGVPRTARRWSRIAATGACWAIGLAMASMWLSSFLFYTTLGFDFERSRGDRVITRYYRVRWDAGVFWIGRADQPREPLGPGLDWWDPGGTLFARSIPPRPRTIWNRWGWWWIGDVAGDPYERARYPNAIASRWLGMPGWIPAVAAAWWPSR